MAESSWPTAADTSVDDIQYEQMATGYTADGVIGTPSDTSVVFADATGMQVKVRSGKRGLVRGRGWYSGTSVYTESIGANSSGSTRIDRVVLRLTRSTGAVTTEVKAGTPGAGAPALTQDAIGSGSNIWEVPLARVTVANGASTINAGDVVAENAWVGPGGQVLGKGAVTRATDFSLAITTENAVSWSDQMAYTVAGMWAGANPTRLVIPYTGTWRLGFRGAVNLTASGVLGWFKPNGTSTRLGEHPCPAGSWGTGVRLDYIGSFTAGDYVETILYQNFAASGVLLHQPPQAWADQLA